MWSKTGLAALILVGAVAPTGAQAPQYFDYPRYSLPGRQTPLVSSPPGRVTPFLGNPGYLSPTVGPVLGNGFIPPRSGWAFAAEGGGVFQPNAQTGVWTLYPNAGSPVNYLELYRTPSYAELYQPDTGTGIRLTNNTLYRAYGGVWYPVFQGWWQ
jgi:hypothetical protein